MLATDNKTDKPIETMLSHLDAKPTGRNQWQAKCPAHEDNRASLCISVGNDDRALLKCHAGCSTESVVGAMGLKMQDLFPKSVTKVTPRIVATYNYCNLDGELLYQSVRFDPKDFRQRTPDTNGGWHWKLNGVQRVLYRLPELRNAQEDGAEQVIIAEGEKDVDNLRKLGFVATCNVGGASKGQSKWREEYNEHLRRMHVVIIADKDDAGRNHARQVAASLQAYAASVKVIELPGNHVKDASDWISAGGTAEQLQDIIDAADVKTFLQGEASPIGESSPTGEASGMPDTGPILTRLSDVQPREVEWLWPNRFPAGRISLLVGRPGEGKSFCTIDMTARITTGSPWPDGRGNAPLGSVLLICAEDDPEDTIRPRLDAHHADATRVHLLQGSRRVINDGIAEVEFTLQDVATLETALQQIGDCKLIIIDPIGSYVGGRTDAHRDNEVRAALAPVVRIARQYNAAVLIVMHNRKSKGENADENAMGSRAFVGLARAVWHLSKDSADKSRRLLLSGKNNLAPEQDGLAFTITGNPAALTWEREGVQMHADDAIEQEKDTDMSSREEAAEWLKGELADMQEHPASALKTAAEQQGFTWRKVQRAAHDLGVKRHRATFGGGMAWRLPKRSPYVPDSPT